MKTGLYNHQVVGASWMLQRELGEQGPWGGILGDEMGMGKTLQALACIVSNRPTEEDLEAYQWEDEIRKHADDKYISSVHYVKDLKKLDIKLVKSVDGIFLASYHDVSRQYPSRKNRMHLKNDGEDIEMCRANQGDEFGFLFKLPFWRVILDEAHHIKNNNSQISIACQNLGGRNRWGMSGTPITNSLDELYPYLKFLKAQWAGNLRDFQYLYGNPGDDNSASRLAILTDILMLRRTMGDSFLGQPLYEIPLPHIFVRRVRLTTEERIIYEVVCTRFCKIIGELLKKNGKLHPSSQPRRRNRGQMSLEVFITFLLRLRQGAAHPFLLEPVMKRTLTTGDLLDIQQGLRKGAHRHPVYKRIGKWCRDRTTATNTAAKEDHETPPTGFGNSQFGYEFNMDSQIDIALLSKNADLCRVCYQEPLDGYKAKCKHIFCKECIDGYVEEERQGGRTSPRCPDCKSRLTTFKPLKRSALADYSYIEDHRPLSGSGDKVISLQQPGCDVFKKHPKFHKLQSRFLRDCDTGRSKAVVPSAKTVAVKEAILEWQSEAPDDKIIVFTEFKMTGAVLGRMLEAENISFLYFFGDMTSVTKNNAIRGFHEKAEIKIASMRCGSVALNLTCANRVILVDLWWNAAIEMQAFARVFRIGQTKETHFLRIIAQGTIDERMEALQQVKMKNIDNVLQPGKRQELSVEELTALFGHLKESKNGDLDLMPYSFEDRAETDEAEQVEDPEGTE
ncbi:P-loop containing nucleoside triphosphate hydrolase protein [Nemania sp. FL0916]|nr:P-loop containing nucleoside triphosphate hydrolase protein [Nemania sp. FL0916]